MTPQYSIVVPVFNSENHLEALFRSLSVATTALGATVEVVFVVDGSPDRSYEILASDRLPRNFMISLHSLSRNFGAIPAVLYGLRQARGQVACVVSADGQEPVELIVEMCRSARVADNRVVVGVRVARSDPWLTRITSRVYWLFFRLLVNRDVPRAGADVFAFSAKPLREIQNIQETSISLVGIVYWLGFERVEVKYTRDQRASGKSSWTVRKKVRYAIDGISAFSDAPIVGMALTGFLGSMVAMTGAVYLLLRGLVIGDYPRGYVSTVVALLMTMSIVLFATGILGTYIWRIAEIVSRRPSVIVSDVAFMEIENQ
jgi:glycosyltransferase involved in cell wall biosynthesis